MSKYALLEDLADRVFRVFSPSEINEPLVMVYAQIRAAIRQDCDRLVLTPDRLLRLRGSDELGELAFPPGATQPMVSATVREAILMIILRDEQLGSRLEVLEDREGQLVIAVASPAA